MKVIRKIIGICLVLIGVIFTYLAIDMILDDIKWGVSLAHIIILSIGIAIIVLGIFLTIKRPKEEKVIICKCEDEKNRIKEKPFIWKYIDKVESSKIYKNNMNMGVIIVFVVVINIQLLFILITWMVESELLSNEECKWVIGIAFFAMVIILNIITYYFGNKARASQISFARNKEGYIYLFDYKESEFKAYSEEEKKARKGKYSGARNIAIFIYNVKVRSNQIARIDREKVLENIMEYKRENLYGEKIVSVNSLKEKHWKYKADCNFSRNGIIYNKKISISKKYNEIEDLIYSLELLM